MKNPKLNKYSELEQIYKGLEQLPNRGRPYCIVHCSPNRYFGFIGVTHTHDPNNQIWDRYLEEWDKFIASKNNNKLVFIEGNHRKANGKTFNEAIIDGGDAGVTAWLADKNGIKCISPEPSYIKQIELLKEKFTEDEIITYFIGRQLSQYARNDYKKYRDIKEYVGNILNMYKEVYLEWEKDYSVDDVINLIEDRVAINITEANTRDYIKIDDPNQNPVSESCNEIRDTEIYYALEKAWKQNKDVFCVFGTGHALVLENAINNLFTH